MAFSDFTFPQVQQDLGLVVDEADLFSPVSLVTSLLDVMAKGPADADG